jgi:hypothetical protein
MIEVHKFNVTLLLVIIFGTCQVLAKNFLNDEFNHLPSSNDCEFYSELKTKIKCSKSTYLQEVKPLCEKYLIAENQLGSEIQNFFS